MYSEKTCVTNGDDREDILKNAPEAEGGAFVVPKTFDIGGRREDFMNYTAVELGKKIKDRRSHGCRSSKCST